MGTAVQVSPRLVEGSTQVEKADTAVAKAQSFMYGEEEPDLEYWKQLAEKRREALETSLLENEELHTSLTMVEEEKEAEGEGKEDNEEKVDEKKTEEEDN